MTERILIAGIGNIFLGDDAFGVEVARRLTGRVPPAVRVVDFGIRGFDLAYALMGGCETAVLVDATPCGGTPGTLYIIEPDLENINDDESLEAHGLTPTRVFSLVRTLGGTLPRVLVLGCEPTPLADEEEGHMGLSAPVQAATEEAVQVVESLVAKILAENAPPDIASSAAVQTAQKGGSP